jgi:hypothetical protein
MWSVLILREALNEGEDYQGFCARGANGEKYPLLDMHLIRAKDQAESIREVEEIRMRHAQIDAIRKGDIRAQLEQSKQSSSRRLIAARKQVWRSHFPKTFSLLKSAEISPKKRARLMELASIAFKIEGNGDIKIKDIPAESGLRQLAARHLEGDPRKNAVGPALMILVGMWDEWNAAKLSYEEMAERVSAELALFDLPPVTRDSLRKQANKRGLFTDKLSGPQSG